MPRGGARPGAGRPRGRRDSKPRRWHRPNIREGSQSEKQGFLDFCRRVCEAGGQAAEIVEAALASEDSAERRWAVQMAVGYAVGTPVARVVTAQAQSLEQMLEEYAAERDREPALLPAGDPNSAESFAREVAIYKARASSAPVPVATTPTPVETAPPATAEKNDGTWRVPRRGVNEEGVEVLLHGFGYVPKPQ